MASLGQGIKILPNAGQEQGRGLEEPLNIMKSTNDPSAVFKYQFYHNSWLMINTVKSLIKFPPLGNGLVAA